MEKGVLVSIVSADETKVLVPYEAFDGALHSVCRNELSDCAKIHAAETRRRFYRWGLLAPV